LHDFSYPWLNEVSPEMAFRALWDDSFFYFRFDVVSPNTLVYRCSDDKMEVIRSDRVELFLRTDSHLNPYYCLEMDPAGRILDYRARFYRQFEYDWKWPGTGHLMIKAAMTPSGYSVEGKISLLSLQQLSLLQNHELQAGLFRGYCYGPSITLSQLRWISWVVPDSAKPDFHIPSAFGTIKFTR
jgi:hypothetical protein